MAAHKDTDLKTQLMDVNVNISTSRIIMYIEMHNVRNKFDLNHQ